MRAVTLEHRTRRLAQLWTGAAVAAAAVALTLALLAGGTSDWTRWVLGVVSIYGFAGASRFRFGLHLGALSGVAMVAIVPQDAVLDRGLVAAIGGVLVLIACELAHVARRLVTIAPVQSTRLERRAISRLFVLAACGVAVTASAAQLDRWGGRPLIIGLTGAGAALVALIGNEIADSR
jgi:hypothetical protein